MLTDREMIEGLRAKLRTAYEENERLSRELVYMRATFLSNVPPEKLSYVRREVMG